MKAVVIGTGFESLASALRLRALGYQVDVLEAESSPGGSARSFHLSGHTVEASPPALNSPGLFDELFSLFNERRGDFVEVIPAQLYRRNLYADGSHLDIVSSIERQEGEIATLSADDARTYRAFLAHCEELARGEISPRWSENEIDFKSTVRSASLSLNLFSNLWKRTGRYFIDRRVRQAFSWHAVAAGCNPLVTQARHLSLHATERNGGMWAVRGGLSTLVRELVALGERHSVRFHYDHKVVSLCRDGSGRVSSIYTAHRGERAVMHCDVVVCGGGARDLYPMIQSHALSSLERFGLRPSTPSFGMYVLFLKTKRMYPEVADQTIVFSDRWEGLLSQIQKGPQLPKDPMFAMYRLSPNHSGAGHDEGETFSVYVPVPHLGRYTGWKFDATGFKDRIVTQVRDRALPGLNSHLVFAESIDPRYARDVLHCPLGALFQPGPAVSHGGGGSFHHRMRKIPNLFLCGAGLGGVSGLSGAVISARFVAERIEREYPSKRPYEPLADIAARSVA